MSANSEGSRGVDFFWKQSFLDLHSDVVIEQLIEDTAQSSTVTIAGMEIKICNLHAPNNGRDRSTVFSELKNSLPPHCVIVGDWESAPAQQQCQKFDVYLLENYFTYVC